MISKLAPRIVAWFLVLFLIVQMPDLAFAGEPMPQPTTTPESWLILPELPETATQADVGAEIYRLVCQDCHGNHGQGLTPDWIATWNPQDQNCWQSKCHAAPIPAGGFKLPRQVPAIMGEGTLSRFATAKALYDFIRQNMPWHTPGSLQDYEYMQLTAFLLRENAFALDDTPLDETAAAAVLLHPEEMVVIRTSAAATVVSGAPDTSSWYVLAIAAVAGFGLALGIRLLRRP